MPLTIEDGRHDEAVRDLIEHFPILSGHTHPPPQKKNPLAISEDKVPVSSGEKNSFALVTNMLTGKCALD